MVDTHCHLSYAPLMNDLDAVLARAAQAGVKHMITIGTRLRDSVVCRDLAAKYPQISCAVGIHPHHAAEATADELDAVMAMFSDPLVIAAGEMGLDYHYEFAPREAQVKAFEAQIAAAVAANKPLVLHCREAIAESLAILKSFGYPRGVMHCYTGTMDEAKVVLDAGYSIGITGIVTFKNADYLRDIAKMVPIDRLLVETDAPYLSPEPHRRQKNCEPALIVHTYRRIAQLRGITEHTLADQVMTNTQNLFGVG